LQESSENDAQSGSGQTHHALSGPQTPLGGAERQSDPFFGCKPESKMTKTLNISYVYISIRLDLNYNLNMSSILKETFLRESLIKSSTNKLNWTKNPSQTHLNDAKAVDEEIMQDALGKCMIQGTSD